MISSSLSTAITNADILPGYKTDHSLITIHLASNSNPRGPGYWKFNTSFLLDSEYIELIKKAIDEVAKEYRNNDDVDAVLLWNTMKMQIHSRSLKLAREKKAKIESKENTLESDISSLPIKLEEENPSDAVCQKRNLQGTRHQNSSARKNRPVPNSWSYFKIKRLLV